MVDGRGKLTRGYAPLRLQDTTKHAVCAASRGAGGCGAGGGGGAAVERSNRRGLGGVGTWGLLDGWLRGSKGLSTHERSYERWTSVLRAFTRDQAKKFVRRVGGGEWSNVCTGMAWRRRNAGAPGWLVAGTGGVVFTRALVRELDERSTSVYERSGKKNSSRRDRLTGEARGSWLRDSMMRQRKGTQSEGCDRDAVQEGRIAAVGAGTWGAQHSSQSSPENNYILFIQLSYF